MRPPTIQTSAVKRQFSAWQTSPTRVLSTDTRIPCTTGSRNPWNPCGNPCRADAAAHRFRQLLTLFQYATGLCHAPNRDDDRSRTQKSGVASAPALATPPTSTYTYWPANRLDLPLLRLLTLWLAAFPVLWPTAAVPESLAPARHTPAAPRAVVPVMSFAHAEAPQVLDPLPHGFFVTLQLDSERLLPSSSRSGCCFCSSD